MYRREAALLLMVLLGTGLVVAIVAIAAHDSGTTLGGPAPAAKVASAASLTPATAPVVMPPARSPAAGGITITSRASAYGRVLFDGSRRAIYAFTKERPGGSPACYGACAGEWPPVLTSGSPRAAAGVRAGLLGTTRRRDGATQATYRGRPLYYYVDDRPGTVLCQNVVEFGGTWLVLRPSGALVR